MPATSKMPQVNGAKNEVNLTDEIHFQLTFWHVAWSSHSNGGICLTQSKPYHDGGRG